jgi:hypothetical protein
MVAMVLRCSTKELSSSTSGSSSSSSPSASCFGVADLGGVEAFGGEGGAEVLERDGRGAASLKIMCASAVKAHRQPHMFTNAGLLYLAA